MEKSNNNNPTVINVLNTLSFITLMRGGLSLSSSQNAEGKRFVGVTWLNENGRERKWYETHASEETALRNALGEVAKLIQEGNDK